MQIMHYFRYFRLAISKTTQFIVVFFISNNYIQWVDLFKSGYIDKYSTNLFMSNAHIFMSNITIKMFINVYF